MGIREKMAHEKIHYPIGNARKCHFCLHRLENGMVPCVSAHALAEQIFGDPKIKRAFTK
jgi:Fe-S-cluster-containing dehydrogenase component